MKLVGLDLGDTWIGTAITDALGMFARPYQTTTPKELVAFLTTLFATEQINKVIIGYPKTMKGTESEQTKKVVETKEKLAALFPQITFILWDERLSSKRADTLKHAKTKEDKIKSHSVAAAFILSSYLDFSRLSTS